MSDRLTAPARSPLRRSNLTKVASPLHVAPSRSSHNLKAGWALGPCKESDDLRLQAAALDQAAQDEKYEIGHLSDVFQKFWQRASQPGGLSPRSQRLSRVIPKPHSQALAAIVKLENVRKQVKLTLDESRKVKELVSSSLQRYFALLPDDKLSEAIHDAFKSFDADRSGTLDTSELIMAFGSMGKRVSEEDARLIADAFDIDHDGAINAEEFEIMIRKSLNLPANPQLVPADA